MIGTSLSHFKITAKLGEGGMGEVYRAEDSKLGREVAIKVLPEAVASDPERLARFQREAQVLASLNHPNIAGIHQVEEAEGVHFLVMEIVEGEDLHERLASGPIPVEQALPIASQMAQALEAAHEKGVIHRDLKPANVRITADGQVKVLDFGLAKALDPAAESGTNISASPAALSLSPTLTQQMTSAGIILGTAAYMSPEQAKGETVDKRADIWSFGLVVFEMLSGRKLFAADSVAETLAGVIKTDINFSKLPSDLPSEIGRLLRRCLDRDAKNRLHDIADARIVVEDVLAGRVEDTPMPGAGTDPAAASTWKTILPFAVGALGLAFGLLWMWQPWSPGTAPQAEVSVYEFEVLPPEDSVMVPGVAISPDGKKIAFAAKASNGQRELWIRDLDSLEARQIPGTNGARYPFWAPDSRQIGFFARGDLKVTDLIGSNPRSLTPVGSETFERGATWGANGDILYAPYFSGGLFRIASDGGDPELFTDVEAGGDIGTHRFPSFLPDGRHFVFYGSSGSGTEPGILLVGDLETGETKTLGPSNSMAVFAEPDFLLHARGNTLVAQRIDLQTFELVDPPQVLEVDLPGSVSVSGHRTLDQARGILVHRLDTLSFTKLVWVDRSGSQIGDISADREAWQYAPRLSPDGKWLAAGAFESTASTVSIMLHDLDRGIATPFQPTDTDQQTPAWSPTGDRIAYELIRSAGDFALCVGSVAHPEEKQEVFFSESHPAIEFFTPDGQSIVFSQANAKGLSEMWLLSLEEGSQPVPFMPGLGSRGSASLSPDGGWVAYGSAESGQFEVYVSPFTGDGSSTRISSQGGSQPLWSQDGTELFYLNAVGEIVSVPVTPGNTPTFGAEQPLFQARLEEASDRQYDVAADGERFVLNQQNTIDTTPIVVTTNWRRLLKD